MSNLTPVPAVDAGSDELSDSMTIPGLGACQFELEETCLQPLNLERVQQDRIKLDD